METTWNSERLTALMDRAGLSQQQLGKAIGLGTTSIHAYCTGKWPPSLSAIIAMADFFAVPIDYFFGRCPEAAQDYGERFMELRRAPYEAYLECGRPAMSANHFSGHESPWPYNIFDAIFGDPIDWIITADHEAALDSVLGTLSDRERAAILLYFKKGLKLEDAGREFNVTRERIRQIIIRAIRKLRHPSRMKLLQYGLETSRALDAVTEKVKELEGEIARLEIRKAALSAMPDASPEQSPAADIPVQDLGLSVRSTNCLWRAGFGTLSAVVDAAEKGKLKGVRNLGRKSLDEILRMIHSETGRDLRGANS